jgi:hypothetical protein
MIDWERVSALRAEIGEPDFTEVVDLFLAEAEEVVERLRRGRPDPTLEAELHFLKGSALNLGLRDLADLCSAPVRGKLHDTRGLLQIYAASRRALEEGLRGRGNSAA